MPIEHFFDKSVVIQRMQTVSGKRISWYATATIDIHIQNSSDAEEQEYFASYSATHKAWVGAESVIREGDRVVDADGLHYLVVNINKKEYGFAMNVHQEVLMKLDNG